MRVQESLLLIAYNDPDRWVACITYIDKSGTVTERKISPTSYSGRNVKALCLGQQSPRTFSLAAILRVRLQPASEVLAPEAIKKLVEYRNKLRK